MTPTLDDYEAAFEGATPPTDPERAWERAETAIRLHTGGPTRNLRGSLLLLALCVAAGLHGALPAWGIAGFLVLVVLPERWRARKRWLAEIAAVESADDMRVLCAEQAKLRMAGVLSSSILQALLALLFLAAALVAHLVGTSPWPGAAAALVVLAWVAFKLLVRLPRASREWVLLDGEK